MQRVEGANFRELPGAAPGKMGLWHFPSKVQLKAAKERSGLTTLVTLQGSTEEGGRVKKMCAELGIKHLQMDWWKQFNPSRFAGCVHLNTTERSCLELCEEIVDRLKGGEVVMLHCAAGIHRTGCCAMMVLRSLGLTFEQAVQEIRKLREVTVRSAGMPLLTDASMAFELETRRKAEAGKRL
uniref:Tyrosine specific protein phosphatases domain-containing protein n=1 Tax=Chromera velia CCMP2878 TaxID=1169474 RepID=A0A0G4F764_9ALVE|eukprot:Cvel_15586.t1-p1 / transcript=Cvel_15586.t1 / gene=Cvel_15586 / organism=Chromera_velia_CCMP2878 / gene_product=hypothetical protein / transcript_product=hypothetical protein / location=Cvel_scaffold1159:10957-13719(+) / protein_length=181 / sequence_SO=supercontig / SO=protein_coding / is_pseudo=false